MMIQRKQIIFNVLFVALIIFAAMCISSASGTAYAAINEENDGVYFQNEYAEPGEALIVKYDGIEKNISYKWYVDGEKISKNKASYTIGAAELQKMIKAEVWSGSRKLGEADMFCSNLPVLYIETEGGKPVVSKDNYIDADIHLQGNHMYDPDNTPLYTGATEIKGRGNSTWKRFPKKPYKLKLDKKTDLLGMGKNKHWVLLANYIDESCMRNMLAGDIATRMGVGAMDGTWVEVVLNGKPAGNYMLCEHVRISEDRVDVFDWEEAAEDIAEAIAEKNGLSDDDLDALIDKMSEEDMSWISSGQVEYNGKLYITSDYYEDLPDSFSGGYLMELDFGYDEVSKFTTVNGAPLMFKSPEFINTDTTAMSAAQNYIQQFETALYSTDYCTDIDGRKVSYTELCDAESFANFWLASEILINEVGVKSTYFQKDIDQPIKFGPVWDFDFSSGSVAPFGAQSATDWIADSGRWWIGEAVKDPYFVIKARTEYLEQEEYLKNIVADDGLLDEWYNYLYKSGNFNSKLWKYSRGFKGDYEELDSWLTKRLEWMDEQFATVESAMNSMGITFSSKFDLELTGESVLFGDKHSCTAKVGGDSYNLTVNVREGVYPELNYYINSKYAGTCSVTDGKANIIIFEDQFTEKVGDDNVITVWLKDGNGALAEQQYMTVKLTSDTAFHNVVFNDMGATRAEKVRDGKKIYLQEPLYQSAGAVFEGWSDGNTVYEPGNWMTVNNDITFNAVWTMCTDGTYVHDLKGDEDVLSCTREGCNAGKSSGKTYIDVALCIFNQSERYNNKYTGEPVTPVITVTYNGVQLVENRDYSIKVVNNIEPGFATYTVTGIKSAGYTGEVSLSYRIIARDIKPLTQPVVKVVNASYNQQQVTWSQVEGASKYEVYRSADGKNYELIKTVEADSERAFLSKNLKTGKLYYYKVIPFGTKTEGNQNADYKGPASDIVKLKPVLAKGNLISVKNTAVKSATVKWKKVNGANGYKIYRSATGKKGSFKVIKTIKSGKTVSFKNKKLKKGKTYYYKIKPYRIVDDKRVYGKLSGYRSVKIKK